MGLAAIAAVLGVGGSARADGRNVLYLLDVSGSMGVPLEPDRTSLQAAVGFLEGQLSSGVGGRSGLVTFGGPCSDGGRTVADFSLGNESRILASARAAQPGGATPLYDAISEAGKILTRAGGGEIVLLTDGLDTCGHAGEEVGLVKSLREKGIVTRVDVATLLPWAFPGHLAIAEAGGGEVFRLAGVEVPSPYAPGELSVFPHVSAPADGFSAQQMPPLPFPPSMPAAPPASRYERPERYNPEPVDPSSFPEELVFGEEERKPPRAPAAAAKRPAPARTKAPPLPELQVLPLN